MKTLLVCSLVLCASVALSQTYNSAYTGAHIDSAVAGWTNSTVDSSTAGHDITKHATGVVVNMGTRPLFVFGAGIGQASDTVAFGTATYDLGSFYNKGTDTIVVTSLMSVLGHGVGTDTLNVDIQWHATKGSGSATHLITNGQAVNSITTGNETTSFTNSKIPPNVWVWCYPNASVAGRRPVFARITLSGYWSKP
jgi:hypothetical protein